MKKKLYFCLISILIIFSITKIFKYINNQKVLKIIQSINPEDNFYFIRGLDRDRSLSTNIKYRGIIYSDQLKEANSFSGIQVALENLDNVSSYENSFKRQYENAFAYPRAIAPIKENARQTFGEDIIVYINFPMVLDLKGYADFMEKNIGKIIKAKGSATVYIDVFVDDIKKIDIDEYKKKLFNLHQILYKKYNIDANINMNLRDRKYLTYEKVESNIFYIFKDEPKVKELLKKYKKNGTLNPNEMGFLMNYFVSTFGKKENIPHILFQVGIEEKIYKEINVILPKEMRRK